MLRQDMYKRTSRHKLCRAGTQSWLVGKTVHVSAAVNMLWCGDGRAD